MTEPWDAAPRTLGAVRCVWPAGAMLGEKLARVTLPAAHITDCAFGGPDLKTLFISSARSGLDAEQLVAQPLAGGLFSVEVDTPGILANAFAG